MKKTFRRLFTRLVTLGEGQEDTRRVVERRELAGGARDEHPVDAGVEQEAVERLEGLLVEVPRVVERHGDGGDQLRGHARQPTPRSAFSASTNAPAGPASPPSPAGATKASSSCSGSAP